jgi:uncharacterized membrane protein
MYGYAYTDDSFIATVWVIAIVVALICGAASYSIVKEKGYTEGLYTYFILGLCLGLLGVILAAVKPESPNKQSNGINNKKDANLDMLMKYKELLDMGAITQEEFDKKKSELM